MLAAISEATGAAFQGNVGMSPFTWSPIGPSFACGLSLPSAGCSLNSNGRRTNFALLLGSARYFAGIMPQAVAAHQAASRSRLTRFCSTSLFAKYEMRIRCGVSMRLASVNMQKAANNMRKVAALERWLSIVRPEIVMMQEPVVGGAALPLILDDMHLISGNAQVACWSHKDVITKSSLFEIPALTVETHTAIICNTYLSASSRRLRIEQLAKLRELLRQNEKSIILLGDFNLAPDVHDGLYGDDPSTWTNAGERRALKELVTEIGAMDLLSRSRLGEQHFTLERIVKSKWSRFRCDLVFAPDSSNISARYDHSVRLGPNAFTDHSACIIELGICH